ncbi:putative reverse transcriptase domain-containing protein [Tanacetum coccineum]
MTHLPEIIAASAIAIFFYSSNESVGSPPSQVILFGDIPTIIPSTSVVALEISTIAPVILSAAPVVETTLIASPTGLAHFTATAISPLCTDSFEAPDSSDGPPSQDPYVATVARWRSRVTTRPSSSSEFPIAPVIAIPRIRSSVIDFEPQLRSSHSARPSRKRCRSPVNSVPSSTPVMGSLDPTRADLLPPRKRFRDSYLSEASIEEDTEIDPIETEVDMELGIGDGDDVRDHVEIDPRDVREKQCLEIEIVKPTGEDSFVSSGTRDDIVRSFEDMPIDLNDVMRDFYHHMSERVSMIERVDSLRLENLKVRAMLDIKRDRVNSLRLYKSLSQEEFRQRTIRTDDAYALSWRELLKLMTEVYCPRNEIQKMETELWNLSVKNNDMATYTQRFQELTMMCTKMVPEEEDRVERFIGDQNLKGYGVRNAEYKRRLNNNYRNKPLRQHSIPINEEYFRLECLLEPIWLGNNEKNGLKEHFLSVIGNSRAESRGVITCFECGAQGHYRKGCPKVKNQNRGNKARVPVARGKAYILGGGDANPGSNTVMGMFLLNDHHAYMLFDSGADRSFVSNTFSALLDIIPYALDVSYAVELADGRTSETNTVLRGCTLGLLGHPFNIDLMPIDLGSFDVIIGMDCDKEKKSTLSIISCEKAQKYMEKGCQLFLAKVQVKRKQRQVEGEATRRRADYQGKRTDALLRIYFGVAHEGRNCTLKFSKGLLVSKVQFLGNTGYQKELNMRQRRLLELLSDYNCELRYHPGKANVVADALI